MSWRKDSTAGARIWDTQELTSAQIACRDEELAWLMKHERRNWRLVNGRIVQSGDPTMMAEGLYAGLQALPPAAAAPSVAVTATTTPGVALWTSGLYTPILSNGNMFPSYFKLSAAGTVQTSTTSMTSTLLAGISAATSGAAPSVTTKTFGASGAATLAATALTAIFQMDLDIVLQAGGTSGTAVCYGKCHYTTAAAPATSAQVSQVMLGGTQATAIDFTGTTASLPGGLFVSSWASASTVTWVPQIIALWSPN